MYAQDSRQIVGIAPLSATLAVLFTAILLAWCNPLEAKQDSDAETAEFSSENQQQDIVFVRDIRPLFEQRCYSCHGPDVNESGLRLDDRESTMLGGDRGRIITRGDTEKSRLIDILKGDDHEIGLMPPEGEGTPFSVAEIELIQSWIAQGANWPKGTEQQLKSTHWAFQSIIRPDVPGVTQLEWVRSPIDHFILRKLEGEGIIPSPPASRTTIIRRVYLDLLGLLPSPKQVEQFLGDDQPGAYERLIDRVLSSPHFGERWGRHWLDLARYADTDGYEKDRPRPNAWRYRDWVIDAINQDLSFAEFSRWQIAGDMLPHASAAQRIACGFHRNTLHNTEGGIDPEEDRFKKTIDRTNTFGAIWLGMTVGCAQCHSHKYDPLTQREYYSLYAYFNQIDETEVAAPAPYDLLALSKAQTSHSEKLAQVNEQIAATEARRSPESQADWEKRIIGNATVWRAVSIESFKSRHGASFAAAAADGQVIVTGPNEGSDHYTLEVSLPIKRFNSIRLEVLPSEQLPKQGPGRAANGNFVLAEFSVSSITNDPIKLTAARADFAQNDFEVGKAINGNKADGWAIGPKMGQRHVAVFQLDQFCTPQDQKLRIELDQSYPNDPHNLGSFRISVANVQGKAGFEGITLQLFDALQIAKADRNVEVQGIVNAAYDAAIERELMELQTQLDQLQNAAPSGQQFKARSVKERQPSRDNPFFTRGDFLRPSDNVAPRIPSVLSVGVGSPQTPNVAPRNVPRDRKELADWLFSSNHPLTSRVTANRIWFRLFGSGLVTSIDDFGLQSDTPSHPELLDWLACELQEKDWSVKQLVRTIVLSSTYRQRGDYRPELVDIDPNNRWLARQNRRRVEAEIVRDVALTAAGLLDRRIGGPSVRPPQPTEYASLTYANSAKWKTSKGGDAFRRGLYTFFQRTSPYPMLTTFDCPDSNQSTTQRNISNTPIQSLTLWNDPVFFACARALAVRIIKETPSTVSTKRPSLHHESSDRLRSKSIRANNETDQDSLNRARIRFAYRCCLSRDPSEAELETLSELHRQQLNILTASPAATEAIIGDVHFPSHLKADEFAAWVMTARTLINLDEFIMKE